MAAPAVASDSGRLVIRNIGLMLSGDITQPILDADTLVVEAGRIVAMLIEVAEVPDILRAGSADIEHGRRRLLEVTNFNLARRTG